MQETITVDQFKKRLDAGEVPFIFDLRDSDEFKDWHVEGRNPIETLNIPQEDFVGEEERYLAKFPKDRSIITFCAHGDAARYSADTLRQHGFNAVALEGGMDLWSEYYEYNRAETDPEVYQVYRAAKGCIAYLAHSDGTAVVVDAPRHTGKILDLAEKLNVKILHVLDTHLHADHVSGGRELAGRTGAAYHVNPLDAGSASYSYTPLVDGSRIPFGSKALQVLHSPGHTPGSTSFLIEEKCLFTGDIIMKESIGRPDLGGMSEEWATDLHQTLFRRYARLSDDIVLFPAHASGIAEQDRDGLVRITLGQARRTLDLFQLSHLPDFLARVSASLPENPARYADIRKVNLARVHADEAKQKELEIGKNLCGMRKKA